MSVRRLVEVYCNGPSGGECPTSAAWTDAGTAAQILELLNERTAS